MAKGRLRQINKISETSCPPAGAVGTIWSLPNGNIAFVPDDVNHLPPDCPIEDFGHYEVEPETVEILKDE